MTRAGSDSQSPALPLQTTATKNPAVKRNPKRPGHKLMPGDHSQTSSTDEDRAQLPRTATDGLCGQEWRKQLRKPLSKAQATGP
mmetsp:Transcript_100301/g.321653  ORF Transcript_100301/g.321653 Transcript_100301/m.321653 type:complete len:84 (+) Transcript_100301:135-386(+)